MTAAQRGETLYNQQCVGCHAATNGIFPNLADKRVFDVINLTGYIDDTMPIQNPGGCVGQCASDVAAYVATFHEKLLL